MTPTKESGSRHGPAGPVEWVAGEWVRSCKCGRTFKSRENWQHVPTFYDHLAIADGEDRRMDALVAVRPE